MHFDATLNSDKDKLRFPPPLTNPPIDATAADVSRDQYYILELLP